MKINDSIPKDMAFIFAVMVLFSSFAGYCVFTYCGYVEAEHAGLYKLFDRGFDITLGAVIGIVGRPAVTAAINGLRKDDS